MKNLLLGTALNYGVEQVRSFILSFRKHNSKDDIALLISPEREAELSEFFATHSVKGIIFNPLRTINPCNTRLIKYRSVIDDSWMYDAFLISDVRDVVFQADPFKDLPRDFVYCFEEDSGATIGSEEFNSFWVRNIYGEDRLEEVRNSPIVCAGTIMGSRLKLLDLLTVIIEDLEGISVDVMKFGMDQGILNNICRSPFASIIPITLKKNGDIVATLGITLDKKQGKDTLTIDSDSGMITINTLVPAVIHQYDRSEVLKKFYAELA